MCREEQRRFATWHTIDERWQPQERAVYGQITKFDDSSGIGVIVTDSGDRFRFRRSDVTNLDGRLVGYEVDFELVTRQPRGIVLMTGSPWTVFTDSASH